MTTEKEYSIEIAVTDYASVAAAVAGGADRIELCTALSEGGLTPSKGMIEQCRADFNIALFPIIRPRSGDFLYTKPEFDIIKKDALFCKEKGCDGIVVGFLKKDGQIDIEKTAAIVEAVYPLEVTFHRAFDRCHEPLEALEELIRIGCQRILTSGQQPTAPGGIAFLRQLVEKAADRITIMPGSGVRASNIKQLAIETGAVEFHSSLKAVIESEMDFKQPAFVGSGESYSHPGIIASEVRALRAALYA